MLRKRARRVDKGKAAGTRSRVSKKPWKNARHVERVRAFGCLIGMRSRVVGKPCGGLAIEVHHCRKLLDRGHKLPRDDRYGTPLCTWHHNEAHEGRNGPDNEREFWKYYRIDPAAWIASFSEEGRQAIAELTTGVGNE